MAPHSSTLAWRIPWTEEPGGLQSTGPLRVRHDWATSLSLFTFMHWRRKWQPTPVFLPGESQGGEAWWAAVYGVAQSWTRLNGLSSSSSSSRGYMRVSVPPHSHQHLAQFFFFFNFSHYIMCVVVSCFGFNLHFFNDCLWWESFKVLFFTIRVSSLVECLFKLFAHFLIDLYGLSFERFYIFCI